MQQPFVQLIAEKGLKNLDISMLDLKYKSSLFEEVGDLLLKQQRYEESAKAFFISGNTNKIKESGEYFMQLHNIGVAALYFYYLDDKDLLKKVGELCLKDGYINTAKRIFEKLDDKEMLSFIQENLGI